MIPAAAAHIYTDFQGLAQLRRDAQTHSPEALRAAAQQFEALFLQILLKGMRGASFDDGLFDSEQTKFYQELFDQQIAVSLTARRSIGLADMLARQLAAGPQAAPAGAANRGAGAAAESALETPEQFVAVLRPLAGAAAQELGVAPEALLAQAALETGWGKSIIRHPDGRSSHNLFGIKADARWDGPQVGKTTVEYEHGLAVKRRAAFRAYDSYAASFQDYVAFLHGGPRYGPALAQGDDPRAFVRALQEAGYATDPAYADKIAALLEHAAFDGADRAFKISAPEPLS